MNFGVQQNWTISKSVFWSLEVAHLLAHPDWANDLILLDQLGRWSSLSTCCKYVPACVL